MTTRQEHGTTGTARREARRMSGRGLVFDIHGEVRALRDDLEFTSAGRAVRTLAKTAGLRVTLVVIKKEFGMKPEAAAGASIHVLEERR